MVWSIEAMNSAIETIAKISPRRVDCFPVVAAAVAALSGARLSGARLSVAGLLVAG
jgi:hypothetical protein